VQGCPPRVRAALLEIEGVHAVRVWFADRAADVYTDGRAIVVDRLIAALAAAGFPKSSHVQVSGVAGAPASGGS